jgi:hypothetical protein
LKAVDGPGHLSLGRTSPAHDIQMNARMVFTDADAHTQIIGSTKYNWGFTTNGAHRLRFNYQVSLLVRPPT